MWIFMVKLFHRNGNNGNGRAPKHILEQVNTKEDEAQKHLAQVVQRTLQFTESLKNGITVKTSPK